MDRKDENAKQGVLFNGKPIMYDIPEEIGREGPRYDVTEAYGKDGLCLFSMGRDVPQTEQVQGEPGRLDPDSVYVGQMFQRHFEDGAKVGSVFNSDRIVTRAPLEEDQEFSRLADGYNDLQHKEREE